MDWETLVAVIAILRERRRAIMLGHWEIAHQEILLTEIDETIRALVELKEELRH